MIPSNAVPIDEDVVQEFYDHSFCDDSLKPPTLLLATFLLIAAIAAPLIYTGRGTDALALLGVAVPAAGFALWAWIARRREVALRQLFARAAFGWLVLLPGLWAVCAAIMLLFANFLFVATYLPVVLEQLLELGLWVAVFAIINTLEDTVKAKCEADQHFGQLPVLRTYTLLGGATAFGYSLGTTYYLSMVMRYVLEQQRACHSATTTSCFVTAGEMIILVVSCAIFAQCGHLLGWLHSAAATWRRTAVEGQAFSVWNAHMQAVAVGHATFSGTCAFTLRQLQQHYIKVIPAPLAMFAVVYAVFVWWKVRHISAA